MGFPTSYRWSVGALVCIVAPNTANCQINPYSPTPFQIVAKMSPTQRIKKGGLDEYGPKHFEVLPSDTTGLERVNGPQCDISHTHHVVVKSALQ